MPNIVDFISDSQASKVGGVHKVLHADDASYSKWVAEKVTQTVAAVQVRTACVQIYESTACMQYVVHVVRTELASDA